MNTTMKMFLVLVLWATSAAAEFSLSVGFGNTVGDVNYVVYAQFVDTTGLQYERVVPVNHHTLNRPCVSCHAGYRQHYRQPIYVNRPARVVPVAYVEDSHRRVRQPIPIYYDDSDRRVRGRHSSVDDGSRRRGRHQWDPRVDIPRENHIGPRQLERAVRWRETNPAYQHFRRQDGSSLEQHRPSRREGPRPSPRPSPSPGPRR